MGRPYAEMAKLSIPVAILARPQNELLLELSQDVSMFFMDQTASSAQSVVLHVDYRSSGLEL